MNFFQYNKIYVVLELIIIIILIIWFSEITELSDIKVNT